MEYFSNWPEPVRRHIRGTYGEPTAVERLGGMSLGAVYRVRFQGASAIVKATPGTREARFYATVAPALREQGVPCPALEWSEHVAGASWLILEDVPHPLPPGRWLADPEMLAVLSRLHTATLAHPPLESDLFRPAWTDEITEAALSCFPEAVAAELGPPLRALQERHQYLFLPQCLISGDPNRTNWGLRGDGTLVLYDWERFGYGTPPLDLAIATPGLGDAAAFAQVAAGYLAGSRPALREQLADDIGIAKVWNVVEFLYMYATGDAAGHVKIDTLVDKFPAWLREGFERGTAE
jgi:aminoglycoside phosphotransferase (APT) family kinase protein